MDLSQDSELARRRKERLDWWLERIPTWLFAVTLGLLLAKALQLAIAVWEALMQGAVNG